jgi:hypothetical protein
MCCCSDELKQHSCYWKHLMLQDMCSPSSCLIRISTSWSKTVLVTGGDCRLVPFGSTGAAADNLCAWP